eukprot:tig00020510_g9791.t1
MSLRHLLDKDIVLDFQDSLGRNALHLCSKLFNNAAYDTTANAVSLAQVLLEFEPSVINTKDNQGRTPLSYASIYGFGESSFKDIFTDHLEVEQILCDDVTGMNALLWAAYAGCKETANLAEAVVKIFDNSDKTNKHFGQSQQFSYVKELKTFTPREQFAIIQLLASKKEVNVEKVVRSRCSKSWNADGKSIDGRLHAAVIFAIHFGRLAMAQQEARSDEYAEKKKEALKLAVKMLDEMVASPGDFEVRDPQKIIWHKVIIDFAHKDPERLSKRPTSRNVIEMLEEIGPDAGKLIAHPCMMQELDGVWRGKSEPGESIVELAFLKPFSTLITARESDEPAASWDLFARKDMFFGTPRGKFFMEFAFYVMFLAVFTWALNWQTEQLNVADFFMAFLLVSFVVSEGSQAFQEGPKYFTSIWNFADVLMVMLFIAYYGVRIKNIFVFHHVDVTTAYRILAFNSILLWTRLLNVCDLHSTLGPLLTIIKNMATDTITFLGVLLLVMLGFSQLLHILIIRILEPNEQTPQDTILFMFKTILGDSDIDYVIENSSMVGFTIYSFYLGAITQLKQFKAGSEDDRQKQFDLELWDGERQEDEERAAEQMKAMGAMLDVIRQRQQDIDKNVKRSSDMLTSIVSGKLKVGIDGAAGLGSGVVDGIRRTVSRLTSQASISSTNEEVGTAAQTAASRVSVDIQRRLADMEDNLARRMERVVDQRLASAGALQASGSRSAPAPYQSGSGSVEELAAQVRAMNASMQEFRDYVQKKKQKRGLFS